MRVFVYPGDGACGEYRVRLPARAAAAAGVDVSIRREWAGVGVHRTTGRVVTMSDPGCDVVVIQRPMSSQIADAIPLLQRHGVAVVCDIDDDFASLHPSNPAYRAHNPRFNPRANWTHMRRALSVADAVTVTTPALAHRYGSRGNAIVVPNCVPKRLLDIDQACDANVVGWAGSIGVHPGDLQVCGSGVAEALRDTDARFRVVGDNPTAVGRALHLDEEPEATGYLPLDEYHAQTARLAVGLVPLAPGKFNDAKSALKGLEYAALGVPFVASDVADYERIASYGIGTLAGSRSREWRREVRALLTDHRLRQERAALGREAVRHHTIEANIEVWAEAWAHALARRRDHSEATALCA